MLFQFPPRAGFPHRSSRQGQRVFQRQLSHYPFCFLGPAACCVVFVCCCSFFFLYVPRLARQNVDLCLLEFQTLYCLRLQGVVLCLLAPFFFCTERLHDMRQCTISKQTTRSKGILGPEDVTRYVYINLTPDQRTVREYAANERNGQVTDINFRLSLDAP